jgi:hypothetical protein
MKKYLLGSLAVFIAWSILDFVIHGHLLGPTYAATASLWRPMDQMNMGLMSFVRAVCALTFTGIYAYMVRGNSVSAGLKYGLVFGLGAGVSMGFGSYGYMPIPMSLAWGWFLSCLVSALVGGAIIGGIIKPNYEIS